MTMISILLFFWIGLGIAAGVCFIKKETMKNWDLGDLGISTGICLVAALLGIFSWVFIIYHQQEDIKGKINWLKENNYPREDYERQIRNYIKGDAG